MLIFLIIMAVMLSRKKSIAIFLLLGVIAAGIIFSTLGKIGIDPVARRAATIAGTTAEMNFASRSLMYQGAVSMIKDSPFVGTGIGTLIHTFPKYRPLGLNMLIDYVHNDYLHTAAETGIFSLLLLLIMAILFIGRCLYIYRYSKNPFKHGLVLAILIGAGSLSLHGLVDFNFHIPANAILFSVLTGLAMGLEVNKERAKGAPEAPPLTKQ